MIDGAKRRRPTADRGIADWDLRVSALTPASIDFLEAGRLVSHTGDRTGCYTGMKVWDGHGSGRIASTPARSMPPISDTLLRTG